MTGASERTVIDPTLYRCFTFLAWAPRELPPESNRNLETVERVLRELGWLADDGWVPGRHRMAWARRVLWDSWRPDGDWLDHRFGQSYHEVLTVLLGVEQVGDLPFDDDWLDAAKAQWSQRFGADDAWRAAFVNARDSTEPDRPRLLGEFWVWTGEWPERPQAAWTELGQAEYGPNSFVPVSWGMIGCRPDDQGGVSQVDVHTTVGAKDGRDLFLYTGLTILLAELAKTTQFLQPRYEQVLGPRLDNLERKLAELVRATLPRASDVRRSVRDTENAVVALSDQLLTFSRGLADLDDDARGADIARDAIRRILAQAGANADGPWIEPLVWPVERFALQAHSDLDYYRTTQERARQAIQIQQTFIAIDQTRASTRLVIAGILLGTFIGLGQILDDLPMVLQLLVSVGGGLLCTLIYWFWPGRKYR